MGPFRTESFFPNVAKHQNQPFPRFKVSEIGVVHGAYQDGYGGGGIRNAFFGVVKANSDEFARHVRIVDAASLIQASNNEVQLVLVVGEKFIYCHSKTNLALKAIFGQGAT
jgi:hypothetical protein